jgi:hypothetical protein
MKQILPIVTLTTLAAAASAQSAPAASGLDYNRVSFSRASQDNTLGVQALLGGSNVLVGIQSATSQVTSSAATQFTLGYVFKNVAAATDVTVSASQNQDSSRTIYSIGLRRQLNEVLSGLEVSVAFSSTMNGGTTQSFVAGGVLNTSDVAWNSEIAYNINKNYQVAVGLVSFREQSNQVVATIRYNF